MQDKLWQRTARAYVEFSYRHPWPPILIFLALGLITLYLGTGLRIETDLRVLLPKKTPSVQALEESERRMGSTDLFTLAIQAPSAEAVAAFQRDAAAALSEWEGVSWVQFDQERGFFEEKALLYMPLGELEDLRGRISDLVGKTFVERNPFLLDLGDDDEDSESQGLQGWPDTLALRRQGLPPDIVAALLAKINTHDNRSPTEETSAPRADAEDPVRPDSLASRLMGWDGSRGAWVGVVLAQLDQPSTNAQFAQGIFEKGEALIRELDPGRYHPEMIARVAGAYRNFSEIKQVNTDMALAGTISFLGVSILLFLFLRRFINFVLVMSPIFIASFWTLGVTYLIYGRLTLLTAFILSLVLGLGIEYSIHLFGRWAEERRKGQHSLEAMVVSLTYTGRALLSGAATNIFAMLSLQAGNFTGFKEYGIVVSLGIAFCLIASWVVIPPLFFLFTRWGTGLERAFQNTDNRVTRSLVGLCRFLLPGESLVSGGKLLPRLRISGKALNRVGYAGLAFTCLLLFTPPAQFENDFRNLRGESTGAGISYGRAVGSGRNTSPSIILGHSVEQMRQVHDSLAARFGSPPDSMLQSFVTISSFVPTEEEQSEKIEVLEEINELLDARALANVDGDTREKLDLLRSYASPRPFDFSDLPEWARRFLTEADGSHGKIGYMYGRLQESDAIESGKFQDRFGTLHSESGPVQVASSGFIYADVVRMVKRDGVYLALATVFFLMIITWVDMRNWRGMASVLGFILLSGFWTYALMGLFGLKLGMFNLVIIPTILSVSVDSVIHMYHRRMELGAGKIGELIHTTGSAVLTGTLTNAFGFAGLCFVNHKGLQTLGYMATLGIASGLVILFTILPWFLERICPKEPVREY